MSVEALKDFVDRYGPAAGASGPVNLVREVLGAEPDEWQTRVLEDYGRRERQIAIESCHGPGKTAVLAWIVITALTTRFPQKTAATAPTGGQLYDALFAEVKMWIRRLPGAIQELFIVKGDRIELAMAPESSFASFRTARPENPEALQGVHAPWVTLIADEASGVPEPIFEAAIGSMASLNATTILAGNPVRSSGFFYNAHHGESAHSWRRYHISAIPGEHCGEGSFVSKRVPPEFVRMIEEEWGRESNAFRVRVMGRPPLSDADTIIPFEWIEAAGMRDVRANPVAPIFWGVDVARGGADLCGLAKRQSHILLEPVKTWSGLNDVMLVVGSVKAEWDMTALPERPAEILVDVIGLGAGVADRLRELGLPARGVNVSENPALDGSRYRNLRTELAFLARDWFARRDCSIPKDEKLVQELAAQKYKVLDSSGKVIAIPKDQMQKYLHPRRSPDRADAFFLTFAGNAVTAAGMTGGTKWNQPLVRNVKGIV